MCGTQQHCPSLIEVCMKEINETNSGGRGRGVGGCDIGVRRFTSNSSYTMKDLFIDAV